MGPSGKHRLGKEGEDPVAMLAGTSTPSSWAGASSPKANPPSSTTGIREQSRAGEASPIHQQLVDTTGNCRSTGLKVKFKLGAYVTAFWQGDKLWGVRGPQMDAFKEGRCLLDRVPLH